MSMIQDDGSPWVGPGFDFDKPKGAFGETTLKPPAPVVESIESTIKTTLKRIDWELLDEDGTGQYVLAGENKDEE